MFTRGVYRNKDTNEMLTVFVSQEKNKLHILLGEGYNIVSAYYTDGIKSKCYKDKKSEHLATVIKTALNKCTSKNATLVPFVLGTATTHTFETKRIQYQVQRYNNSLLVGCYIESDNSLLDLQYDDKMTDSLFGQLESGLNYVELRNQELNISDNESDDIPVRPLEEIALEKDLTWLKNKKYYVVNDDAVAEQLFSILDSIDSVVSYDTETTGLRINIFSKVNSKYEKQLEEYNKDKPKKEQIHSDKLVGIIFCVEDNVSYYFPVRHKKFRNLYETDTETRIKLVNNFKAEYTIGSKRCLSGDIADYWRKTPVNEIRPDVILMERCRNILTTKHIVAHNGSFEWKVSYCYDIDLHLCDDTMLMHQLMYKFRTTTSNRGEPSNLKYLTKVELGIDQLDLHDFFVGYKEDTDGLVKGKKKKVDINFSYMDFEGTRAYGPADGDTTLQIWRKYKKDLIENHKDIEYLYQVELKVACAIGYMEFYGIKIDEEKINDVCEDKKTELLDLELQFRESVNYTDNKEKEYRNTLKEYQRSLSDIIEKESDKLEEIRQLKHRIIKEPDNDSIKGLLGKREQVATQLKEEKIKYQNKISKFRDDIREYLDNSQNVINLGSPAQVSNLFFNELGIETKDDSKSVDKKIIKGLRQLKNEDESLKYPMVDLYAKWKDTSTLITKFFDKIPQFMFPGGYIHCSFGQISCATGRMSCSKPNAQQFCKALTKLVIPRDNNIMIDADFSQIEYRTLVAMANETSLIESFFDPDSDYHTMMASLMFGVPYASVTKQMRGDAKSFNFGIPYGMGFKSLAIQLSGRSDKAAIDEAKEKYALYFKDQPNVKAFFERVKESALIYKYTKTLWGRRRYYSFTNDDGTINEEKKGYAQRQAGNAAIQGTAADIFKISVARNFEFIRKNNLLGKLLIINMVHDEQLMEIDCNTLNPLVCYKHILNNMQFNIEGFPPLYVGAGFGFNWNYAKDSNAEIHPILGQELCEKANNYSLMLDKPLSSLDVFNFFNNSIMEFRTNKVKDYITNKENWGKNIHPVIGNLLLETFNYGVKQLDKESNNDYLLRILDKFIEVHEIQDVNSSYFSTDAFDKSAFEEEDKEYLDDEEELDEDDYLIDDTEFALIDNDDSLFGSSVADLIREFGYFISPKKKICGVNVIGLSQKKKKELVEYLTTKAVDREQEGSMQLVFLRDGNLLHRTEVYVSNIDTDKIAGGIADNVTSI